MTKEDVKRVILQHPTLLNHFTIAVQNNQRMNSPTVTFIGVTMITDDAANIVDELEDIFNSESERK
jgi:uncharacterized protein YlxP (DUF503 family)